MPEVTKRHRLAVARAWGGSERLSPFIQRWVETGALDSGTATLERLAQLVADAEGAWIHVDDGLPDSDVWVLAVSEDGSIYVMVQVEFSDDSDGNGAPYWAAEVGDWVLSDYPFWRPLPAAPKPPEQP